MTDLIEKVARAIYDEADKHHKDRGEYVGTYRWRDGDTLLDGDFDLNRFAKAAIQTILREMMEPTEKMLGAGHKVNDGDYFDGPDEWKAMLKAFAKANGIQLGGEDEETS